MTNKYLNKSISDIMSSGGDHRITISERTGLNKYGCKPYPGYVINFGSSTSNNISFEAYSNLLSLHDNMLRSSNFDQLLSIYRLEFEKIRSSLNKFLDLNKNTEIFFGPSGTDLELIILGIGLSSKESKITNIIIAPDEGGSGIIESAQGQHFSDFTALGIDVNKGEKIKGYRDAINTKFVYTRSSNGTIYSDDEIFLILKNELLKGINKNSRVVIHCMHISKLGRVIPSLHNLKKLINLNKNKIDIVIDACQGRISPKKINEYLNIGAI